MRAVRSPVKSSCVGMAQEVFRRKRQCGRRTSWSSGNDEKLTKGENVRNRVGTGFCLVTTSQYLKKKQDSVRKT